MSRPIHQRPTGGWARASQVLAGAALLCVAAEAMAAAAPAPLDRRVLLVIDRPNDPLIERIRAELTALGLSVLTRASAGPLEDDAREQHAVAAIRVLPSRKGVEVWMADITTGRTLARQLVVDERAPGPDHGLIALQTAEILRTGLFPKSDAAEKPEVPASPPPPPPPPPPTTEVSHRAAETTALAGFGGLYSPGGVGTALQLSLSLRRSVRRGLGLALEVSGPARRASLAGPEGRAQVAAYLAGLAVFLRFPAEEAIWFLTTAAGAAVVYMRTDGQASQDYPSFPATSSSAAVGAAYARVDVGWKPARWARVGLAGIAGSTLGHVVIRFTGNQAGTWGDGFFAGLMVVGAEWE